MTSDATPTLPAEARVTAWDAETRVSARAGKLGIAIFGVVVLVAVLAPLIVPYNPLSAGVGPPNSPPSAAHWFGTDPIGMDVLSRVMWSPRIDLLIAAFATAGAFGLGTLLGSIAGYAPERWRNVLVRGSDLVQAFPFFILALLLVTVTGPSLLGVIFVVALLNTPLFLRLTLAEAAHLRSAEFVESARLSGVPWPVVVVRHVLPNSIAPALIQFPVSAGWSILFAAGLSFVGAGIQPPTPEWGTMIASGAQGIVTGQWWTSFFPGASLFLTVLSLQLIGAAIEERYKT